MITMYRHSSYSICVVLILLTLATTAYAVHNPEPVLLNTYGSELLFIVENKLLVVPKGTSIPIELGSQVCVGSTTLYVQPDVRLVFKGWLLNQIFISRDNCITMDKPGTYIPKYSEEYLVRVVIEATGDIYSSWVERGSLFTFSAPEEISTDGIIYRFSSWSTGIDPDNSTLILPITSPTTVKAYYRAFYPVRIYGINGQLVKTELLEAGSTLVIRVDETIDYGNNTRSILENIRVIGDGDIREVTRGTYIVRANSALDVVPLYATYYRVVVDSPAGSEEYWVRRGNLFEQKARETILVSTDIRLRFRSWEGDVEANMASFSVTVEKPMKIRAVYVDEYRVEVEGPLGRKEFWLEKGSKLPVYMPEKLQGVISSRVLKGYIVNEEYVELGPQKVLLLSIDRPYKLVAVYETEIEWINVAILVAVVLAAVALYLVYEYITTRRVSS